MLKKILHIMFIAIITVLWFFSNNLYKATAYDGSVHIEINKHAVEESNLDDYLKDQLLECIKRQCDALLFFKEEIFFRFTIGAMDDKVLSYWEPTAPSNKERKQPLAFAYNQGFNTSVDIEPMLDSPNIKDLVEERLPIVNDVIWIGKMNHIGEFRNGLRWQMMYGMELS